MIQIEKQHRDIGDDEITNHSPQKARRNKSSSALTGLPTMKREADLTTGDRRKNRPHIFPRVADEVDFDVVDPPLEPVTPPSFPGSVEGPTSCRSTSEPTTNDVLMGRGGRSNCHIGNRLFRSLVSDFRPMYLTLRRREKPRLSRTIVLIIRRRGGAFPGEGAGG